MKKALWALVFVFAVTLGSVVFAQEAPPRPLYIIQPGDTLWEIAKKYLQDPQKYEQIISANSFLNARGRVFRKNADWVVVITKPGEKLAVEQLGITAKPIELADLSELAVISLPTPPHPVLAAISPPTTNPADKKVVAGDVDTQQTEGGGSARLDDMGYRVIYEPFPWIILGAILIIAGYLLLRRYYWWFQNPVTSGEPIIQGGLNSSRPNAIERRFRQIAQRQLGEINPMADLATEIPIRIGPIEEGTLSGNNGRVHYRGKWQRRRMHREPAYRARFRFPNNTEEDLFFLQRCANDVRFNGMRYVGYRFEPTHVIVEAPAPQTTTAQMTTSALPKATVPTATQEAPQAQIPAATVTITIGTVTLVIPSGSSISMDQNGAISVVVPQPSTINVLPVATASSNNAHSTAASSAA